MMNSVFSGQWEVWELRDIGSVFEESSRVKIVFAVYWRNIVKTWANTLAVVSHVPTVPSIFYSLTHLIFTTTLCVISTFYPLLWGNQGTAFKWLAQTLRL